MTVEPCGRPWDPEHDHTWCIVNLQGGAVKMFSTRIDTEQTINHIREMQKKAKLLDAILKSSSPNRWISNDLAEFTFNEVTATAFFREDGAIEIDSWIGPE